MAGPFTPGIGMESLPRTFLKHPWIRLLGTNGERKAQTEWPVQVHVYQYRSSRKTLRYAVTSVMIV